MATSFDYRQQAQTYDLTRAASPSVLNPLAAALGEVGGGVVLDVGGGTGNYAAALAGHGWSPVVLDRSAEMLALARGKGLPTVRADASCLPVPDGSVDAALFVSMLHHVPDWADALEEAKRVLRPGGRLVFMGFALEHFRVHWIAEYFPTAGSDFRAKHQSLAELRGSLQGAHEIPVIYEDHVDGSLAAMCRFPEMLLNASVRRQTSFFEWADQNCPEELTEGVERLRDDLGSGTPPHLADDVESARLEIGDALVMSWTR